MTDEANTTRCGCRSYNHPEWGGWDSGECLTPPLPSQPQGRSICLDACISDTVYALWERGIWTEGSCCGHGRANPSLILGQHVNPDEARLVLAELDSRTWDLQQWRLVDAFPGFGPHHTSPESDPQALRYELDGCRAEIERLRAVIGAMKVETRQRFHRRSDPPEGWRKCQNFTIDEQTGLLHEMFTNAPPDKAPYLDGYDVVWIVSDPFTQRRLVEDWTPAEPPPFVDEAVPAPSPVLGESGEGT